MEKITHISGTAIPLLMDDVDTDLIIPAQYLTSVSSLGYGEHLFQRLKESNPAFPFNRKMYDGSNILIARHNFGCGSSREHAVWALKQAGIDAIIAISFADIFFNNSAKNSLVLIKQPEEVVHQLLEATQVGGYKINIDIKKQTMQTQDEQNFNFELEPFHQYCFLNGLDELDYLLSHHTEIERFYQEKLNA